MTNSLKYERTNGNLTTSDTTKNYTHTSDIRFAGSVIQFMGKIGIDQEVNLIYKAVQQLKQGLFDNLMLINPETLHTEGSDSANFFKQAYQAEKGNFIGLVKIPHEGKIPKDLYIVLEAFIGFFSDAELCFSFGKTGVPKTSEFKAINSKKVVAREIWLRDQSAKVNHLFLSLFQILIFVDRM